MALMPMGQAAALGHPEEPRDTDTACPDDSYPNPYPDLFSANHHYHNITCMTDYGIARGFRDGTYRPPSPVTRDQMATFIANLIETATGEELAEGDHQFDDVGEESPHYDNVHKLAAIDVVEGRTADTYAPRAFVRRDQMASFINRAIDYSLTGEVGGAETMPPPDEGARFYTDVFTANTHSQAIGALTNPAIVVGFGDDTYGPRDNTRRDQMASFIMRALDYILVEADEGPVGPSDATIVEIEVDTADRAPFDGADYDTPDAGEEFDTWEEGEDDNVQLGDQWHITFSEDMDTDTTGVTIDVTDTDGTSFTVECVDDAPDSELANVGLDENVDADCEFEDLRTLTVTLLQHPVEVEDGSLSLAATYPLDIDDVSGLETVEGGGVDVSDAPQITLNG